MRTSREAAAQRGPLQAGFTLLELVIATAMVVVILVVGASLTGQASATWHYLYHDTEATHDARSGLLAVAADLRQSERSRITVDTAGAEADVLTYQVPVGRADGVVFWGAGGTPGGQVRVSVIDGRLCRTVQVPTVAARNRPQVLATGVDRAYQGAKAFAVTRNGSHFTIRLRTQAANAGHAWRKDLITTVIVRH
jgi:prepilin-type N-terminal cleavage/methylation domain-containing protein